MGVAVETDFVAGVADHGAFFWKGFERVTWTGGVGVSFVSMDEME